MLKSKTKSKSLKRGLTYKFTTKNGGVVRFIGLKKDEKLPVSVVKVLHKYGFECDDNYDKGNVYYDYLRPHASLDIDEIIDTVRDIVPLRIEYVYTSSKVQCIITLDHLFTSKGCDTLEVFIKAFNVWNKGGRTIKNVSLTDALNAVLIDN